MRTDPEQLSLGIAPPKLAGTIPTLPPQPPNTRTPRRWEEVDKASLVYVPAAEYWLPGHVMFDTWVDSKGNRKTARTQPKNAQALVELEGGGRMEVRRLSELLLPEERK